MTWTLSAALRNARITAVKNAIDADGSGGAIKFCSVGALLQCTIPLAYPCGSVTGPTLTFADPGADGIRVDDEAISYAVIVDNSGDTVMQGTVSAPGGGGDVIVSSLTGAIGSNLRLISGTLSD